MLSGEIQESELALGLHINADSNVPRVATAIANILNNLELASYALEYEVELTIRIQGLTIYHADDTLPLEGLMPRDGPRGWPGFFSSALNLLFSLAAIDTQVRAGIHGDV